MTAIRGLLSLLTDNPRSPGSRVSHSPRLHGGSEPMQAPCQVMM